MTFAQARDRYPGLLCQCGHEVNKHLYCGEHYCISCLCGGYSPADRNEWLAAMLADSTADPSGPLPQ